MCAVIIMTLTAAAIILAESKNPLYLTDTYFEMPRFICMKTIQDSL